MLEFVGNVKFREPLVLTKSEPGSVSRKLGGFTNPKEVAAKIEGVRQELGSASRAEWDNKSSMALAL